MAKKETAEQKLLKIIEASQGQTVPRKAPSSPGAAENLAEEMASAVRGPGMPSFPNLLGTFTGLFKGKPGSPSAALTFGPREINRMLSVAVALVLVAFGANFFSGMKLLNQEVTFSVDTKNVSSEATFFPAVAAITDYLVNIKKRNIFQPYEKKEEAASAETASGATGRIHDMIRKFKLVGISWLDSPQSASAMIEDVDSGVTRFLRVGDKLNQITVKQIYADRILLSYEGEELVLKL